MCAKGPNNASLNTEQSVNTLSLCTPPPSSIPSLSLLSFSLQVTECPKTTVFRHPSKINTLAEVLIIAFSCEVHEKKLIWSLLSSATPPVIRVFQRKVNVYLIGGLLSPELRMRRKRRRRRLEEEEEGGRASERARMRRESLGLFYRPDVMRCDTPVMSRCDSL